MSPEIYSYLVPHLFAAGALDVYLTNVIMKKNRPGIMLSVLAKEEDCDDLETLVLRETTTLGVRRYAVQRKALERKFITVDTTYGPVTVKVALLNGSVVKHAPEYEDCQRQAEHHKVPMREVYREAEQEAQKRLHTGSKEMV